MSAQNTAWKARVDQRAHAVVEKLIEERDDLKAYAESLENAGDALVAEGPNITTVHRWHQAREEKP